MGSMLDSYIRDPQRENHRLTGQTNELLKDLNKTVEKLGGGAQAAFG